MYTKRVLPGSAVNILRRCTVQAGPRAARAFGIFKTPPIRNEPNVRELRS